MQSAKFSLLAEMEPARQAANGNHLSPVWRPIGAKDGFPKLAGIETCYDSFEKSVKEYADCPCLGDREVGPDGHAGPFVFHNFREVGDEVSAVGSAYAALGLKAGDRIGVLGANSRQWMTAMQGMNRMSMVCVPLYETLGDSAVEFIITHAGRFVVSHASKLKLLVKAFASAKVRGVADVGVAYWGEAPADVVKSLEDQGVRVLPWDSLLQLGRDKEVAPVRPGAEDLCTIMYTSGTTGDPKGVMITHRAVVSMIAAIKAFLEQWNERIGPSDSYLSYLPLAHIFDRVVEELMIHVGGCVGYWQGDIRKLMDDVAALRPTIFAGVPRVFERVYNGIKEKLAHGSLLTRLIFQWAYARKEYYMKQGYKEKDASIISDLLVFKGVKAKLGGRVRVLVSGSAPLSTQMEAFMRVVVGAPFVQGYGLTETCAASFIASPDNFSHLGTVGAPMPATELRLEEVPELGYSPAADPPRGEVCIRGPAMFSGYYGQEALTKEAMDADGFFHTGDVGEITADGSLKIIDRKKNIFKLSQGEYVAVEKVENVYKTCPLVEQCWVYGDSLQPCLVGLVVPAEKPLMAWAAENGVAGDFKTSPAANAAVLKQMTDTGKAEKLNSLEQVKAVVLTTEQFTVENDLMTPSYKLKRAPLLKRYKREVDEMYTKMAEAVAHRAKTHAPAGAAH